MKYLNIAFLVLFTFSIISCGGDKSKATAEEKIESMEIDDDEDEIIETESDETDYLEAAMTALETGDLNLAATEVLNAIKSIEGFMGELDDPSMATKAITELTTIVTALKSGTAMTADDLQKKIMSLELFSDDELEIDENEIDQEETDEELDS